MKCTGYVVSKVNLADSVLSLDIQYQILSKSVEVLQMKQWTNSYDSPLDYTN
jgi:hypothetical protein